MPRRCWPPSRYPPEAGSALYPTPAAPGCSPPTRAATRACRSPPSATRPGRAARPCSRPRRARPARSTPPRRSRRGFRRCLEPSPAPTGVDAVMRWRPDRGQRPGPGALRRPAAGAARRRGDGPDRSGPAAAGPADGAAGRPRLRLSRVRGPGPRPRRALRHLAGGPPDRCPDWRACAGTGPGSWSPRSWPAPRRRLAARRRADRLLGCYGCRWSVSAGDHRRTTRPPRRPVRRPGRAQGRTCPAWCARATPARSCWACDGPDEVRRGFPTPRRSGSAGGCAGVWPSR